MKKISLLKLAVFFAGAASAQPSNDDCTAPILLNDVTNWCSSTGQYTNAAATDSGYGPAACMTAATNDVWFAFTAQFTDINIIVRGKTASQSGGSLIQPEVALYLGTCGGSISELECTSDPNSFNIIELYKGGLFVGAQYLIRVQGAGGKEGTFQICLNNYNPPVAPQSDCPKAAILCDKSAFAVKQITGSGSNSSELSDATCFSNGIPGNYETNSTWFSWTCAVAGPLTFVLTPSNATDDLDFVVYELPNGLANCSGKKLLRCMAAGDFTFPSPCMGPTGLATGSTDISESAGCGPGKDSFIAPLDMELGKSYALCVNNFTSTGNGFDIQFGGTGEFLGPEADFTTVPSEVCLGIPIVFTDASKFPIGQITKWDWIFGVDAMPQKASGQGPHSIQFGVPGIHSIVLTLETNLGCKLTDIKTVLVHPPVEIDTVLAAPDCNGGTNGTIQITNITSGTPPYLFSWNGAPFQAGQNSLSGLPNGIYNCVIKDSNLCETSFDIQVKEKELALAPAITPPLCTGQSNGQVLMNVTNGTAPFIFNWGSQPGSGTSLRVGLPAGIYTVSATDGELCKGLWEVVIEDHLPVEVTTDTTNISCFGANDGVSTAIPAGGVGNFSFNWNGPGGPFSQNVASLTDLGPGQYSATVTDGNGCTAIAQFFVEEPGELGVRVVKVKNVGCFGDQTGVIYVESIGGRPPFEFSADGQNFTAADSLVGLAAGVYTIYIRDSAGCTATVPAEILQPAALQVIAERDTTLELGHSMNILTSTFPALRPVDFMWIPSLGLSCDNCPNPIVTPTESMNYVVKITDEDGCMGFDTLQILITKNRPIYLPNVIAPEKNSPNDHFTIFGGPGADKINVLRIFDRWGELVFERKDFPLNDPYIGWDATFRGKYVDSGVYAFYVDVHFIDNESIIYKGDITVIR